MNEHYPFTIAPLPYSYTALEPYIDERTLHFHHDKHYQAYADKLNATLSETPNYQDWSLKALLIYADGFPPAMRTSIINNGGGVYNHTFYFDSMGANHDQSPQKNLEQAIAKSFGSYEQWKKQMKEAALTQFGSGWVWLTFDAFCTLQIIKTSNQEVPLPSLFSPLLALDVWEHAYYLQYQNRRDEYIDNWFRVVDWEKAEKRFACG